MPRGRIPEKPWQRKSTGVYYTTINGRQVPLGKNEREAKNEFHRIMAERGDERPTNRRISINELKDEWLSECELRLRSNTMAQYRNWINDFAGVHGTMQARLLRPSHVTRWANSRKWTQSTRHIAMTVVKLCFRWARKQKYINENPIADLERPGIVRRRPITMKEAEILMEHASPVLQLILRVLLVTGLRPGEALSLNSQRIDLEGRKATVQGKRTRSNPSGIRTIPISDAALSIVAPLAGSHPDGPIFIGQRGPLTIKGLETAVVKARETACQALGLATGSLDHLTAHCFRGLFSTEALRRGVDSGLVSKLLGQSDPTILMKHYAAPDDPMLLDAMNRATRAYESKPDKPRDPPG